MTTQAASPGYCAFLLRCWQETSQGAAKRQGWRFSLEDPHTGARRGFASFEALLAFLHETLRDDPCSTAGPPQRTQTEEQTQLGGLG